jgi:hypothetical protein
MKRSHRNRSGMAALFDALMFLCVMSVISVTVLVAFAPAHATDRNVQSYVQKCHSVLLGTTLRSWSESSDRLMPVSDAIATLLFVKTPLPDRIRAEVEMMLQGLFLPQFAAEWKCSMGDSCFVFGACVGNATGSNVFVSTLSVAAPSGLCTYVLTVSYA